MNDYMNDLYTNVRHYDLMSFWRKVCKDKSVLQLMLKFAQSKIDKKPTDILSLPTANERLQAVRDRVQDEMTDVESEDSIFASGAKTGIRELSGQRVLQVATILRNLSFEEDNAIILARNLTLLR